MEIKWSCILLKKHITMDAKNILNADLLDIIFEGRNKEYGAYDLRRSYNNRLRNAFMITMGLLFVIIVGNVIAGNGGSKKALQNPIEDSITLADHPKDPIPPLTPPPKFPPQAKTVKVTPPLIVRDKDVQDPPPENKDFIDAKVDLKTQDGITDNVIGSTQVDKNSKVIVIATNDDSIFRKVEIEAQFPGGDGAWVRYVTKAVTNNIDELSEAAQSGTVHVGFVVYKDGSVSDVEAIDMKGTKLAEVAISAIRKGPKWVPAVQNGRNVNAYRIQPVTFNVQEP